MHFPSSVEIIEVGPRDGIQNEEKLVATADKKVLIQKLANTGIQRIETASFVHPKVVPQMADAPEIVKYCNEIGITYIALTPNMKALERAMEVNVKQIAVFVGASNTFNEKNIRRSIDDSLAECKEMFIRAKDKGIFIRVYVSMAFSCPYEGKVPYDQVQKLVSFFANHGADELSIGDTNGQANPRIVYERFARLREDFPNVVFVGHFHNTNGLAYANIVAALQAGVEKFDTSIGGLGGCPFSPGATGNVATEKVVDMLHRMDISTGIAGEQLFDIAEFAKTLV